MLRPRQQFEWAATAAGSHVRFLATVDSVILHHAMTFSHHYIHAKGLHN